MSHSDEVKSLLKDTLNFLKNIDKKYIRSNSSFFDKDLKDFVKKKNDAVLLEKKKFNVTDTSVDPYLDEEKKQIQKNQDLRVDKDKNLQICKQLSIENNKIDEEKKISQKLELEKNNNIDKFVNVKDDQSFLKQPLKISKKEESRKDLIKDGLDKERESKKVIIEEKPKIFEDDFTDIKKSMGKLFPHISMLKEPIDDKTAKQKSQKYKLKNISSSITILAYKEDEKLYRFLEKLSISLSIYFYPSKVVSAYLIEKENSWDNFLNEDISLIISSDYTIFELKNLRSFYKENPSKNEKFLKNIPLFLLPDIFLYLKEPTLKKSLFNALKQKIYSIKNDE